jgi:hypothetical protein
MSAQRSNGPLPGFLVALTVVTGLVDAFSYLSLGHVFVANMTGNVVFLGFAMAGAGDISITRSLTRSWLSPAEHSWAGGGLAGLPSIEDCFSALRRRSRQGSSSSRRPLLGRLEWMGLRRGSC